ncbi:MAG: hypothetical protein M3R41_06280, partial [Pseudomonadota bacterium]|nr:hypothetical protein [Pseudomonadota bacterium]
MRRYMDDRQGYRQLVAVHMPGDFVDLHAFPMTWLDHDAATLGPVTIGIVPHEAQAALCERYPHVARILWLGTLLDAAKHPALHAVQRQPGGLAQVYRDDTRLECRDRRA